MVTALVSNDVDPINSIPLSFSFVVAVPRFDAIPKTLVVPVSEFINFKLNVFVRIRE